MCTHYPLLLTKYSNIYYNIHAVFGKMITLTSNNNFFDGLKRAIDDEGKFFHVHPDGTPAYEERYDYVENFHEGLACVMQNEEHFHILPDGKPAYKEKYGWITSFREGFAKVTTKEGKEFHIHPDGTPAYEERYDYVENFHEEIALAIKDGEWMVIRKDGCIEGHVIKFLDEKVLYRDTEGNVHERVRQD